jgi:hypothetical protein
MYGGYRWRETDEQGQRVLRKEIVGTIRELRTKTDAQTAAEALRLIGLLLSNVAT